MNDAGLKVIIEQISTNSRFFSFSLDCTEERAQEILSEIMRAYHCGSASYQNYSRSVEVLVDGAKGFTTD